MSPIRPQAPEPLAGGILLRFSHPEPAKALRPQPKILPVFLPFAGCPQRCVFCNQPAQTGALPEPLAVIYARLEAHLCTTAQHIAQELAFYGGTFTALPEPWPQRFLELAARHAATGRITRVRCSTRPDAIDAPLLAKMRAGGLSLVELGVQSFDDAALAQSLRGYDGAAARAACLLVRQAGLGLGIQLLPGLPGQSAAAFRADIAQAAALKPELTRLYPCLVLEDTPLAGLWRGGGYAPWDLEATVDELAQALLDLWAAGVPAARIGLAEQEGLGVLAGPRHPALGQLARSRALLVFVRAKAAQLGQQARTLRVPRRMQGEVLGHKNALAGKYSALGLAVRLWDEPDLALCAF